MLLNCDMGESFGAWKMGDDEAVMPVIDMASIACGFHAGDPHVMQHTVRLAAAHQVRIGAHPSYPDLAGFGRRSMQFSDDDLAAIVHYQIGALEAICAANACQLTYVKPHGALYNDMQTNPQLFSTILTVIDQCNQHRQQPLQLLTLARIDRQWQQQQAAKYGIPLLFEAFADRRYEADGQLRQRKYPDAVLHDADAILQQVGQLARGEAICASDGSALALQADTLCVHGDNPQSVAVVKAIRDYLNSMAQGHA